MSPYPPVRIGIDARNLALAEGTGVATYARVLAEACRGIGMQPELLFDRDPAIPARASRGPGRDAIRLLRACLPGRVIAHSGSGPQSRLLCPDIFRIAQVHFNLFGRPLLARCQNPPKLMHWTYPLPLYMPGVPNLVTIHDLIPLLQPGLTGIPGGRMRRLLLSVISRAERIVTVSETVRRQIMETLGVPGHRVVNLYQAVDLPKSLLRAADTAPLHCPPGSFVCFGTVEPRKNIARLIEAHALSGVDTKLVILGPEGTSAKGQDFCAGSGNVLRIPWVKRAELVRAIREARAVLFPSLAEGFGLAIAEAMALGSPVMTSRGGATEEIAGGAALLVDPLDIRGMAAAIAALDGQPGLRENLRAAGLRRAGVFSLEAYTARLRQFYGSLGLTGAES